MRSLQSQLSTCNRLQRIVSVAVCIGLVAFYVAGYRPTSQRLAVLNQQIASRQRDLDTTSSRLRNLPILAAQVQHLETQVQSFDHQLPRQPTLDRFIKDITDVSRELNLRDWRFSPCAPVRGEGYFELPIQMQFSGDYGSAAAFVRRVEDLRRLTRVKKLTFRGKTPRNGIVDVDLVLSIYFSEG